MISDDPDEVRYEQETSLRDPARATRAIEDAEIHLRYELPKIKWTLRFIAVVLLVGLWRIW